MAFSSSPGFPKSTGWREMVLQANARTLESVNYLRVKGIAGLLIALYKSLFLI
jgi:hypothetical protein